VAEDRSARVLEELVIELRDAFAHLHDRSYLLRHPLTRYMRGQMTGETIQAADELRRLLLQSLDELRPGEQTPASDPAWRPYNVIHRRYVLGEEATRIERELTLGTRQVQREQRRGLELIATALLERERLAVSAPEVEQASALARELSRLPHSRVVVDGREQWERALAATRALAESYGVRLAEATGAGDLSLLGDPALLRQLFVLALSFAVKLMPRGWVAVSFAQEGEQVLCRLCASPGAAAAPPSPGPELPSRLVALAEAQRAAVAMSAAGGRVELALSLPAAPRESTVAIVEDNQDVVDLFMRYLKGRGYRLLPVMDATRALESIRELAPDAVILDVMMREVDGWEVLQRLKADVTLRRLPVIVCSVLSEPELAASLGAAASLVKPVRPTQLVECLDGLLR